MELSLDEQRLIAEFRRLNQEERQELLDFASLLQKGKGKEASGDDSSPRNSCTLDRKADRPETAKEPIFTE